MAVRYSHPPEDGHDGVYLMDHLEDVAERVSYLVPEETQTPDDESIRDVVKTLAYVHDFGKATTYFQQHISVLSDSPDVAKPLRDLCQHHAPVGAFAAYYALDAQGFSTETCLAGFVAVSKHHGTLPDVADYVFKRSHRREQIDRQTSAEKRQTAIKYQLKDIHEHVPQLATEVFEAATNGAGSWKSFATGFDQLRADIEAAVEATDGAGFDRSALSDSCYALVLECWGALVLADKTSAADAASETKLSAATYAATQPTYRELAQHIRDLEAEASADPNGTRTEQLNYHRSRAREGVIKTAEAFAADGGGVATLTLPTGMGKTLSGLSAAFTIRDQLGGDRVVYALPFTSIIDQVVDELQEIYETDITGRVLTAHHHLSETTIIDESDTDANEADQSDDIAGMLAESWRAGLTATTFVQLFESLAGPANRQSMKLPALRNSVIILDEPQSLPLDWWKLVPRLVEMLTERYDATVIAMTATQPQLFEDATGVDATELVNSPDSYFETTERVTYELDPSTARYLDDQTGPKSYDDGATALIETIETGASALAVCNTIDSTRKLTHIVTERCPELTDVAEVYASALDSVPGADRLNPERVASRIQDAGSRSLLHLSTRLRPVDRLKLIEVAKELTNNDHALLTISTQLVEAGVDISFDHVYRDLAPIDSIVQAAGRCNRSFERDQGRVTVWWLDVPEEQEKTPAEAVYNRGTKLLPVTAETLDSVRDDGNVLGETTVARDAVEEYYETLRRDKNVGKEEYVEYVNDVRCDRLEQLSLISQRRAVDVIVCRTADERQRIHDIKDAWESYDFQRVRSLMDGLKEVRISVPVYDENSPEAEALGHLDTVHSETDIRWVDVRKDAKYFDPTTGFVVPETTAERRIL
jgi:CRISPR-associated endonuclease Cas3-HD